VGADGRRIVVEQADDPVNVRLDGGWDGSTDVLERDEHRRPDARTVVVSRHEESVDVRLDRFGMVRPDVRQHLRGVAPDCDAPRFEPDRRDLDGPPRPVGELLGEVREYAEDPDEGSLVGRRRDVHEWLYQRLAAARVKRHRVRDDVDHDRTDRRPADDERRRVLADGRAVQESARQFGNDIEPVPGVLVDDLRQRNRRQDALPPRHVEVRGESTHELAAVCDGIVDERRGGFETGGAHVGTVVCQPGLDGIPDVVLAGDTARGLGERGEQPGGRRRDLPVFVDVAGDRRRGRGMAHQSLGLYGRQRPDDGALGSSGCLLVLFEVEHEAVAQLAAALRGEPEERHERLRAHPPDGIRAILQKRRNRVGVNPVGVTVHRGANDVGGHVPRFAAFAVEAVECQREALLVGDSPLARDCEGGRETGVLVRVLRQPDERSEHALDVGMVRANPVVLAGGDEPQPREVLDHGGHQRRFVRVVFDDVTDALHVVLVELFGRGRFPDVERDGEDARTGLRCQYPRPLAGAVEIPGYPPGSAGVCEAFVGLFRPVVGEDSRDAPEAGPDDFLVVACERSPEHVERLALPVGVGPDGTRQPVNRRRPEGVVPRVAVDEQPVCHRLVERVPVRLDAVCVLRGATDCLPAGQPVPGVGQRHSEHRIRDQYFSGLRFRPDDRQRDGDEHQSQGEPDHDGVDALPEFLRKRLECRRRLSQDVRPDHGCDRDAEQQRRFGYRERPQGDEDGDSIQGVRTGGSHGVELMEVTRGWHEAAVPEYLRHRRVLVLAPLDAQIRADDCRWNADSPTHYRREPLPEDDGESAGRPGREFQFGADRVHDGFPDVVDRAHGENCNPEEGNGEVNETVPDGRADRAATGVETDQQALPELEGDVRSPHDRCNDGGPSHRYQWLLEESLDVGEIDGGEREESPQVPVGRKDRLYSDRDADRDRHEPEQSVFESVGPDVQVVGAVDADASPVVPGPVGDVADRERPEDELPAKEHRRERHEEHDDQTLQDPKLDCTVLQVRVGRVNRFHSRCPPRRTRVRNTFLVTTGCCV